MSEFLGVLERAARLSTRPVSPTVAEREGELSFLGNYDFDKEVKKSIRKSETQAETEQSSRASGKNTQALPGHRGNRQSLDVSVDSGSFLSVESIKKIKPQPGKSKKKPSSKTTDNLSRKTGEEPDFPLEYSRDSLPLPEEEAGRGDISLLDDIPDELGPSPSTAFEQAATRMIGETRGRHKPHHPDLERILESRGQKRRDRQERVAKEEPKEEEATLHEEETAKDEIVPSVETKACFEGSLVKREPFQKGRSSLTTKSQDSDWTSNPVSPSTLRGAQEIGGALNEYQSTLDALTNLVKDLKQKTSDIDKERASYKPLITKLKPSKGDQDLVKKLGEIAKLEERIASIKQEGETKAKRKKPFRSSSLKQPSVEAEARPPPDEHAKLDAKLLQPFTPERQRSPDLRDMAEEIKAKGRPSLEAIKEAGLEDLDILGEDSDEEEEDWTSDEEAKAEMEDAHPVLLGELKGEEKGGKLVNSKRRKKGKAKRVASPESDPKLRMKSVLDSNLQDIQRMKDRSSPSAGPPRRSISRGRSGPGDHLDPNLEKVWGQAASPPRRSASAGSGRRGGGLVRTRADGSREALKRVRERSAAEAIEMAKKLQEQVLENAVKQSKNQRKVAHLSKIVKMTTKARVEAKIQEETEKKAQDAKREAEKEANTRLAAKLRREAQERVRRKKTEEDLRMKEVELAKLQEEHRQMREIEALKEAQRAAARRINSRKLQTLRQQELASKQLLEEEARRRARSELKAEREREAALRRVRSKKLRDLERQMQKAEEREEEEKALQAKTEILTRKHRTKGGGVLSSAVHVRKETLQSLPLSRASSRQRAKHGSTKGRMSSGNLRKKEEEAGTLELEREASPFRSLKKSASSPGERPKSKGRKKPMEKVDLYTETDTFGLHQGTGVKVLLVPGEDLTLGRKVGRGSRPASREGRGRRKREKAKEEESDDPVPIQWGRDTSPDTQFCPPPQENWGNSAELGLQGEIMRSVRKEELSPPPVFQNANTKLYTPNSGGSLSSPFSPSRSKGKASPSPPSHPPSLKKRNPHVWRQTPIDILNEEDYLSKISRK